MTFPKGTYPNTFYRVSIKAVVRNKKGEVLLVKEKGSNWSLPGGGMDHGETAEEALAREMYEEALITQKFTAKIIGIGPRYIEEKTAWMLWVVYELDFDSTFDFGKGPDADEVAFIDPTIFKESMHRSEQLVYKWCVDESAAVS